MSWVLTIAGLSLLVILHEFGHFAVAKAVGMRVEKFSLFFGPMLVRFRRGETVYGIGPIPLGGYVKITGMNPQEEVPPEMAPRAYFRQPPWKRVAVILAGPAMNVLIAFVVFWSVLLSGSLGAAETLSTAKPSNAVAAVEHGAPASGLLRPGDKVIAVDGVTGPLPRLSAQIASHRCPGRQTAGCLAATPARVTIKRGAQVPQVLTLSIRPRYDPVARRARIGFVFGDYAPKLGVFEAARISLDRMWTLASGTVTGLARAVYSSKARHQVTSVVGITKATQQTFAFDISRALVILGFISLVLAVVNLFPFLPLDGGHVLWAVAEKVRGQRVSFAAMARFSSVGVVLLAFLVITGISNDINRLTGSGFH